MIYWQNRILTNVKNALGNKCPNVSSTTSNKKSKFPACAVRIVSDTAVSDDLEMDGEEAAVLCGVAVDIYSKTSLAHAIELMDIANKAMYRMGFKRQEGAIQVEDETSPELFHLASRYARVIGSEDTIEKLTFEAP